MNKKSKLIISLALIIFGVVCRLIPHMWNFAPIVGISLFAGVYLGRNYALVLPLIAVLVSDTFIGFYEWQIVLAVYGSYLLIGLMSAIIKRYKKLETIIAVSIMASVLFFIITNWAVWQFSAWYTKDLAGLMQSYTLALPFFRNTLLGNLFYTLALFGCYEGSMLWIKQRQKARLVNCNM
jgi:hypothetical protein